MLEEAYDENDLRVNELHSKLVLTEHKLEEKREALAWWESNQVEDLEEEQEEKRLRNVLQDWHPEKS